MTSSTDRDQAGPDTVRPMDPTAGHRPIFVELPDEEIAEFIARSRQGYVDDLVAAGEDGREIEDQADAILAGVLRDGRLNPDQRIGHLLTAGTVVGHLWVARQDEARWYVRDVEIEPAYRGRGYGRTAMMLAEEMARADGAAAIGLGVLANNRVALALYRSLGYAVEGPEHGPLLRMSKLL
jgi:ribosomal protein S18 acetylase RimI-like enzyme